MKSKKDRKDTKRLVVEVARSVSFNADSLESKPKTVTKERKRYIQELSSRALNSITA